ncbi:hypothetical protein MWU78_09090 [Arenibacter sp. F26102]|uniref:hypothetical protein n=1 Tax=Arenibacter sp. F26102 TaxID=2926416 RepID=UPI001FF6ACBB|nr:hypothetical protein [Arenibacter sp. F26102]MCK0145796.1 hypothetical protein [Arenibacter sp. F26102]
MSRLKELKYFTLIMLLFGFVTAGTLSSCREQKKEEKTEQQGEDMMEEGDVQEEHPTNDADEHPKSDEHPKDSVSE